MLQGIAHVHFLEGERGPEEASLGFSEALSLMERQGTTQLAATFHIRHPSDLRPATPRALLRLIREYSGPVEITLMPEANMVFSDPLQGRVFPVSHDIDTWTQLDVDHGEFEALARSWIVSAHFTERLGCRKDKNEEIAPEQSYERLGDLYTELMSDHWSGWIGHPFRHCVGDQSETTLRRFVQQAVTTVRTIEVPVGCVVNASDRSFLLQHDVLAEYSQQARHPLIAVSIDAHHRNQLEAGFEQSQRLAERLIADGVRPNAIWSWRS